MHSSQKLIVSQKQCRFLKVVLFSNMFFKTYTSPVVAAAATAVARRPVVRPNRGFWRQLLVYEVHPWPPSLGASVERRPNRARS